MALQSSSNPLPFNICMKKAMPHSLCKKSHKQCSVCAHFMCLGVNKDSWPWPSWQTCLSYSLSSLWQCEKPAAMVPQVTRQHATLQASYSKLQRTGMVRKLGITLQELVWAVNVATSRPFAIPKHWTESLAGVWPNHILHTHNKTDRQYISCRQTAACCSCHAQSSWGHSSALWSELAAVCDCQGQILQVVLQLPAGRLPRAEQYTCVGMCCLQGKVSAHHVVNADSVLADSITPIIVGSVGLVGALLFKSSYLNHWQSSKEVSSGCCLPLHPLCSGASACYSWPIFHLLHEPCALTVQGCTALVHSYWIHIEIGSFPYLYSFSSACAVSVPWAATMD